MKKLKSLKQKYQLEEQAFAKIRKIYVELRHFSDNEILRYFDLSSKQVLLIFAEQLKISAHRKSEVSVQRDSLCICTDTHGVEKELYETKSEAQTVCILRSKESGEKLSVYACPSIKGWHLTRG